METCHVEFNFFEDRIISPASFLSDEVPISYETERADVWCCTNPPMFYWASSTGPDLDYAKMELVTPTTPSIIEDGPSAYKSSTSSSVTKENREFWGSSLTRPLSHSY